MGKNAINIMQEGEKALDVLNGKLKQTIENVLAINDAALKTNKNFFNVKSPKGLNTTLNQNSNVVKQLNIQLQERKKLETALERQLVKNRLAESDNAKALASARFEMQQLNKANKEAAILSSSLATVYQKQSLKLTQLRRKYKDVALTQGESSKAARNLLKQITALDNRLKRVDSNVGQFQRNVGNYGKAMQGAVGAARNLAGALGFVGGAFLAVRVVRDATNVIKDFEKENATLSAILQVEKKDMQGLTDEAIRLGSSTVKTAGEVTALQIAFARLGFEQKEIINLTESTINGSIAMNAELDATANLVGAVVNTFDDFGSADAPQILDILSLSTAKSALNFQKLETGIPIVAGAANAAGIPFTKLVALMGKLSDSGIDVSSSSTALRNIFIESAKQGLNYAEIIEKIKGSQDKLTAANDEFGKRAAVSATVLSANIDATNGLDEALQSAAGTAEQMAEKELNTLDGALKLLRSAWEGYILGVDKAGNVSNQLKDFVKGLADNLHDILNTIVKVTKVWFVYIGVTKTINAVTAIYTALKIAATAAELSFAKATGIGRKAVLAQSVALKSATAAQTALNVATKATPWGLIIGVLSAAAAAFIVFKDKTIEATNELTKFNKEVDILTSGQDRFSKALNNVQKGTERANAAVAEQFAILDRLEDRLRSAGIAEDEISRIKEHTIKLSKLSNEEIIKEAELYEAGSDAKNAAVRSSIKIAAGNIKITESIIEENLAIEDNNKKEEENNKHKEKKIVALKGSIGYYNKIIRSLRDEQTKLALSSKAYKEYEKKIEAAKEAIRLLKGELKDVSQSDYDGEGLGVSKLVNNLIFGFDSYARDKDKKNHLDNEEEKLAISKKYAEKRKELEVDITNNILELTNTLFDAKIQKYDDDINRNNDYYANLLDNETLSLEQRSALEAERDRKNLEIEKKKRREQRKQAIINKIASLATIAIQTSTAAAAALAPPPVGLGPLAGGALIPYIIANGALQAAIVAASPIPQYKHGKKKGQGKDSLALLNDGGKDELKISNDGTMERITGRNVLGYVKKSDTIIPDAQKFLSSMSDQELYENLHKYSILSSISHQTDMLSGYIVQQNKNADRQTQRIVDAVKGQKTKFNLNQKINVADDMAYLMKISRDEV